MVNLGSYRLYFTVFESNKRPSAKFWRYASKFTLFKYERVTFIVQGCDVVRFTIYVNSR